MKRIIMAGILIGLVLALAACSGSQGPKGERGSAGPAGSAGAVGPAGPPGAGGAAGAVGTIGPTGLKGDVGPAGAAGAPGKDAPLPPGVARGVNLVVTVSKPANGTHFVAGQAPVVTVTLNDSLGRAFTKDELSTLGLYMYGPQETAKTKSAVKMLNATADRSKTPHHYIDLLTNADAKVAGNVITYNLKAVSDEEAGTYTVAVRGASKADALQQTFQLVDLQIGTATVEKQLVDKNNCAACHLGADSGKIYLHHIDPRTVGQPGSWSIDSDPVRTCKACHNNEGYAAYSGNIADPTGPTTVRTPDPIVRRVHGVHMGEELKNPFNTDPTTGNFRFYTPVVFPANVKNCTVCHVDNRWKTAPSVQACGACHDNTWFGDAAKMPKTYVAHKGGPQADDKACAVCHPADTGGVKAVAEAHKVESSAFTHKVELAMSAPANGKFYVAGEKPTVAITVKDAKTGATIDPKTITEPADATKVQANEFRRGYLFVSGPREQTKPVLTTAATKSGTTAGTYASNDFRVLKDATKMDPRFTRTATSMVYQLDDVKGLKPGTYSAWAETMPGTAGALGGWGLVNFQVGTEVVEKKIATNCTQCHGDTRMHASFFAVQFNPDICKSCHDYKRQIDGKQGWTQSNNGFGAGPLARRVHGVHFGAYLDKPKEVHATVDYSEVILPQDVRNCSKCHDPKESANWKEAPSRVACLACHDKDSAITHASLNTIDPTAAEPYSGDEVETCAVCHGKGREFSPDKVHNISSPYKPPYPRE